MARELRFALGQIIADRQRLSRDEKKEAIKQQKAIGRYQEDVG
ncbi:hypothetical protein EYZ11_006269 [Aspergillus tanneri]|uniref:Uncharacterized protein n=1 Tax=Aspergillus tanneri TaxID=1220188 RepID=A0A4S3JGA5_9EURO|nr:hypothetical protein EYZ11_006269 [Aspergillus tanneri]